MEHSNNTHDELVAFEDSFCAFLDVLGFKEYVLRNSGNHAAFEHVVKALKAGRAEFKTAEEKKFFKVKNFSDNVMVSLKHHNEAFMLPSLLEFICKYQKELVWHGMFVRGGVSFGELYVGDDTIYGGALIEAYEIESKTAVYPAVMLSAKVLDVARNSQYFRAATGSWRVGDLADIFFCFDGKYYINYLRSAFVYFEDRERLVSNYLDVHFLRKHQTLIQERLREYANDSRVFQKYVFLAKYHNAFCNGCAELDKLKQTYEFKDDLFVRIPNDEVSFSSRAKFFHGAFI